MEKMTSIERISNILKRKPVDRIGLFECFWSDTYRKWTSQGWIKEKQDVYNQFGLDMVRYYIFDMKADIYFKNEILEENEETILERDGNGAVLRRHKQHSSTPEHIDFMVKDRSLWTEKIKPLLSASRDRINFDFYNQEKAIAKKENRFFCLNCLNVFECMHPLCGHEHMLMGMALDPDWVKDMVDTYATLNINLMEILFAECGQPDGVWFAEDMGFKGRPFMSPDMYNEIIKPGHKKAFDYVHSLDLPVIVHSCGFIEPLIPGLIEAGMDCLQAIETKAGMDLLKIKKFFGDKIALCGGMDARFLATNDLEGIATELSRKIPVAMKDSGYILHSDHSIPDTCDYETYKFFVDEGLKLGTYT